MSDLDQIYRQIVDLLPAVNITVREEELDDNRGGLFSLKGKRYLLINKKLPLEENIDMMLEILRKENLSELYVLPAIRELLEQEDGSK